MAQVPVQAQWRPSPLRGMRTSVLSVAGRAPCCLHPGRRSKERRPFPPSHPFLLVETELVGPESRPPRTLINMGEGEEELGFGRDGG